MPDGYEALFARVGVKFHEWESDHDAAMFLWIGARAHNFNHYDKDLYWAATLDLEVKSIPITLNTYRTITYTLSVEIVCRRTPRAEEQWKLKTYAKIMQAYQLRQAEYEEKLAALSIREGVQISGRNPKANLKLIKNELRKQCISFLTQQHFDHFDSIEKGSNGLPQTDLSESKIEGPYIRFFEQAFEWENISYVFYPYYWSRKEEWVDRIRYKDTDPHFMDFVMAGAARVVVPARLDFELAIDHFMSTGNIWQGGAVTRYHQSFVLAHCGRAQGTIRGTRK